MPGSVPVAPVMKSWNSRNDLVLTSAGMPTARNWSLMAVATATCVGSLSTSIGTGGIWASGKAATSRARALPSLWAQGSPQASVGHPGKAVGTRPLRAWRLPFSTSFTMAPRSMAAMMALRNSGLARFGSRRLKAK